jgi:hypothetical protein
MNTASREIRGKKNWDYHPYLVLPPFAGTQGSKTKALRYMADGQRTTEVTAVPGTFRAVTSGLPSYKEFERHSRRYILI